MYDEVAESARQIMSREIDAESWVGPQGLLPILNNITVATGGCGNCGHH
jgi:hypothetical protein